MVDFQKFVKVQYLNKLLIWIEQKNLRVLYLNEEKTYKFIYLIFLYILLVKKNENIIYFIKMIIF